MNVVQKGTIGKIDYELREMESENNKYKKYKIILFQDNKGLCVLRNADISEANCFINGMEVGKCRDIYSMDKKELGYFEVYNK